MDGYCNYVFRPTGYHTVTSQALKGPLFSVYHMPTSAMKAAFSSFVDYVPYTVHCNNNMRGKFDSELVSVSQWFNSRTPVCKTGDMRFISQLKHKLFSECISHGCANHATEGKCFCPPSTAVK